MKTGRLRIVIVVAIAVQMLISTAQSNPIKILVTPAGRGAGPTTAGQIKVNVTCDDSGDTPISALIISANNGDSAQAVAEKAADWMERSNLPYDAVANNEGNGIWSITYTPAHYLGNTGCDFTKNGPTSGVPGTNTPGNLLFTPKVLAAAPGTTQLQLSSQATPTPDFNIDWTLSVKDQNDNVLATSLLTAVPDATDAASLIGMFDTSLISQDIPVVADGDTLSLTTANNDYFFLTESATGSLVPLLSDAVMVPEPASVWLAAIPVLLLMRRMRHRE